MSLQYSRLQLATVIAVPIVTLILTWTIVIFYKNRRYWRCYDTAVAAVLIQSALRNVAVVAYTILQMIDQSAIRFDYCTAFVWIFNSTHTFQAGTLSTLAVVALFSIRLRRKREHLKNYLTVAHVVYHLFCLTTLCACVGVAAILAKQRGGDFAVEFAASASLADLFPLNLCRFMPYEMDVRYNVFVVTLHAFLALISLASLCLACYNFYAYKRDVFAYVKKSNSDLSELSGRHGRHWNSDASNVSTTVSSTNSRRPCLNGGRGTTTDDEETTEGVGLETILPLLTVCYLFNHVPIVILCLFPWLLAPWSVATAALCLGLLQDLLIPLSLGLVDTRFCHWVCNVYRCSDKDKLDDKLPQVGLDGKFRPFGTHSGASPMEFASQSATSGERQSIGYHQVVMEPKFPITNGSLYTSVDGRVPIIHNYRRHKDKNFIKNNENNNLFNLGVHATYLSRQRNPQKEEEEAITIRRDDEYVCSACDQRRSETAKRRVSLSQNGINNAGLAIQRRLRLSKSEDSLYEGKKDFLSAPLEKKWDLSDSDEDDQPSEGRTVQFYDEDDDDDSSSSITTEANCDFHFYQTRSEKGDQIDRRERKNVVSTFKPRLIPRVSTAKEETTTRNFRISRSNSKRSLEDMKVYVENNTRRSVSYADLEDNDRIVTNQKIPQLDRIPPYPIVTCGGSVPDLKKIFISDYL